MKKLLALVLALVMTMALAVTSNAAFKDADKITADYKEAVDVMNAVGVLVGDEKQNFNATENLTREQAAKIIAYLELGEKAADALVGSATFTDVAATRWSAGFVSYCAQAGVVAGTGDGKFDPAGQLTALQFGKMLLVEIGYDAKAAGMTGTDWAINTSKLLATTGLMNGIDGSVNQVLTREKAAQMTLNALKTPTVEYATKGSNITVNGAEINFGASVPTYVTNTVAKEQTISDDTLTNSKEYTIELGEKLYKKLTLKSVSDDFGRPAHEWKLSTKSIGVYAEDADATYTARVKLSTIYDDLGLDANKTTNAYYTDGAKTADITVKKVSDKIGDNGVLTQVYYDADANDGAGKLTITHVNTYVGTVSSVVAASGTADRYVNISTKSTRPNLNAKFETEDFAAKDLVAYTCAYNEDDSVYDIKSVKLLEKTATGVLTQWTGIDTGNDQNSFTVDSEKYKYSKNCYVNVDNAKGSIDKFKVDESALNVYVDEYGYALYVSGVKAETNYAAVIGTGSTNQYGSETFGATLLLADGTKKEVTAKFKEEDNGKVELSKDSNGKNLVTDPVGDLVTYYVNKDGVYELTMADITNDNSATGANGKYASATAADYVQFTNGRSKMIIGTGTGSTKYATSETLFFVATEKADHSGYNYNVYKGYANMPGVISDANNNYGVGFAMNSDYTSQVDAVYLATKSVKGLNAVDTFVVKEFDHEITKDSTGSYFVMPAIVDGEITTVKVNAKDTAGDGKILDNVGKKANDQVTGVVALKDITTDKNNILTTTTVVAPKVNDGDFVDTENYYKTTGTVAANGEVVGFGSSAKADAKYWAYTSKTSFYEVNEDLDTIRSINASDVVTDANDIVYFVADDKAEADYMVVKTVIIVKVKDTVASNSTAIETVKVKGVEATKTGSSTYTVNVPFSALNGKNLDLTFTNGAKIKQVDFTAEDKYSTDASNWGSYGATEDWGGDREMKSFEFKVTVVAADNETTKVYTVKAQVVYTLTIDNNLTDKTVKFTYGDEVLVVAAGAEGTFETTLTAGKTAQVKYVAATGATVSSVTATNATVVDFDGEVTVTPDLKGNVTVTIA